ncbi:hypothetical protein ACFV4P_18050 [Kitasatospora sp. NPDC059795]|uniref:hypothetical protein n=1 Tax=Kitasatospora sp. NPDC059795 TaxID=3346949 RepID=UPI003658533A
MLLLLAVGYLLNTAVVLHVYGLRKNRRMALICVAAMIPLGVLFGAIRSTAMPTALLLMADGMLALPLAFWMIRKDIAEGERSGRPAPGPQDRSPEATRRARRAAFAVSGLVAVLVALDYLPILPS